MWIRGAEITSGVDVNYEVQERTGKIISTGTPFRYLLFSRKKTRLFTTRTRASTWDWPPPSPWGLPLRHKIHITLWKQLVAYNHISDLNPKFDYNMIVIYFKLLLVIYITNLYWRDNNISTLYSVQRRNSGTKKYYFFAWENIVSTRGLLFYM